MSWTELLDRLAGVAGLEPWYYDIEGAKHDTTVESKVLVLSALGFDVSSIGSVRASLARLEEEPWRRALSPFIVTPAKSPAVDLFLPAETAQRVHQWRLKFEGGGSASGDFRPEQLPLLGAREIDGRRIEHRRLPIDTQVPGYHRIAISGDDAAQAMLALVPDTSYLPPTLAAGQRLWGLAAHLYTLRSETIGASAISAILRASVHRPAKRVDRRSRSIRSTPFFPIVRRMRAPIRRPAGCFSIRSMSISRSNRLHARAPRSTTFRVLQRFYVPANSSTTQAHGAPRRRRSSGCSRTSKRIPNRPSLPASSRNRARRSSISRCSPHLPSSTACRGRVGRPISEVPKPPCAALTR